METASVGTAVFLGACAVIIAAAARQLPSLRQEYPRVVFFTSVDAGGELVLVDMPKMAVHVLPMFSRGVRSTFEAGYIDY